MALSMNFIILQRRRNRFASKTEIYQIYQFLKIFQGNLLKIQSFPSIQNENMKKSYENHGETLMSENSKKSLSYTSARERG